MIPLVSEYERLRTVLGYSHMYKEVKQKHGWIIGHLGLD